jgi:histidinol phosphatase-like PHP family hydrolase
LELDLLPELPERLPPLLEAPGELAIRAARCFDMPRFFSPSYCFSFFTLGRLFGIGSLLSVVRYPPRVEGKQPDRGTPMELPLRNRDLAELLARVAGREEGHRGRALRRAARAALTWPEEAADVAADGRSLTELRAVGPWVARGIHDWLEQPPEMADPPPLRAGFLTVAEARHVLADHVDWEPQLQADLQMHTTWSDGRATLEEMAEAAAARGYRYVAVTDHSKGLPIARGMDEPTLLRQGGAIARFNAEGGIRLLRALEMNLSPEGDGDMDPGVLKGLDLVLGAFHSRLREKVDQTERYLAAVRNPNVHVLAHPRGRRFGARRGLEADWPRVFTAAVEAETALEIDCHPDRQDLEVELVRLAVEAGAWISIGTDAHSPPELGSIELGLAAAILGGVPRKRILNYLPAEQVVAWATGR